MKQALLITGGTINLDTLRSTYEPIKGDCFVLGVDGGCESAIKADIPLDAIIGDFDTLDKTIKTNLIKSGINTVKLNPVKNVTDTHAAFEYLSENDFSRVIVCGGRGTRFDHTLGNHMVSFNYLDKMSIEFIDQHNIIRPFIGPINVNGKKLNKFKYLSIVPIEETLVIKTKGLKYPVTNEVFNVYDSYGISNEVDKNQAYTIEFGYGKFFVIESCD